MSAGDGFRGAPPDCPRCPELVESRSRVVNGVGECSSGLMLVGEAPGKREDERGEPFVGRSGEILDEELERLGLSRSGVRITNVVRCRPPDNRDPRRVEVGNCQGYFEEEVSFFSPSVVCALGRVAGSALLGESVSVGRDLGRQGEVVFGGTTAHTVLNYHPAATLYDRSKLPDFRETLESVVSLLDG